MRDRFTRRCGAERLRVLWWATFPVALLLPGAAGGAPDLPSPLRSGSLVAAAASSALPEYAVVAWPGPVGPDERERLEMSVELVLALLPGHALLVRNRPGATVESLASRVGPVRVWPYGVDLRLAPEVALAPTTAGSRSSLLLHLDPDLDAGAVADRLAGPWTVVGQGRGPRFGRLRMVVDGPDLPFFISTVLTEPGVLWVELENRRVLLNDTTIWVGQSGLDGGGATPLFDRGLRGEGQIVAVLDTGIDADLCFFSEGTGGSLPPRNECDGGTVVDPGRRKVLAVDFLDPGECGGGISLTEWDTQDHGSHVAGTVAGDDLAQPLLHDPGDGMAPAARLVVQDGGYDPDICADLPGLGCPVVDLGPIFQQAWDQGARIHTNSWGDREEQTPANIYSAGSEDADAFVRAHPDFLLVFAAGNSGPLSGSVASPSTAKNVLSVGATRRGVEADTMASFSSCGPTADGRIKPDVTAPGVSIVSADNDGHAGTGNCGTRTNSGTSMAAPAAAGLAALARQYFTDGWYPSGEAQSEDAFTPSSALLRATLVASARPLSTAGPIPDLCQGWGRLLLDDVLAFSGEGRRLWVRDERLGFLGPGGVVETGLWVGGSGQGLAATLAWTDPPSFPGASVNLVNDLDLELEDPSGVVYRGNQLSGGLSVPGGPADRTNVVERVVLELPAVGLWTVRVRSFAIPEGPQSWALAVTGEVVDADDVVFVDGFESGDLSAWSGSG